MSTRHLSRLVSVASIACLTVGCQSGSTDKTGEVNPSDNNLATIGRMYSAAEQKLGRPPNSADELKPFVPEGTAIGTLLVSPNDNQPYVIVWGTRLNSTPDQSMVLAYERTGANGYRRVLTPAGTMMLANADFNKASFPPGHKPAS
jgi:hypothetical protein